MAEADLGRRRLAAQGLLAPRFDTPEAVVAWLGAVQAQDWYGSLWAVGSRLRAPSEAAVEAAVAEGRIVRTWPMRGTLHFVAPEDVRWMLALLAPRVIAANRARIERDLGLDAAALERSRKVLEKALGHGRPMARSDVYAALEAAGFDCGQMRGLHITGWLAQQGVLCGGPRVGKQPSFVLLDAWIAPTPPKTREEGLHALALRYFRSHGPATAQDFAWWSGLTVKDAQHAADVVADELLADEIEGRRYLHGGTEPDARTPAPLLLTVPFDEYLVGYKDRSAAVEPAFVRRVIGINGLFNASVLADGKVIGTWKRRLGKDGVAIDTKLFRPLRRNETAGFRRAARCYAAFLDQKLSGIAAAAPVEAA